MCGSGCPQFGFPRLRCIAGGTNGFIMMALGFGSGSNSGLA